MATSRRKAGAQRSRRVVLDFTVGSDDVNDIQFFLIPNGGALNPGLSSGQNIKVIQSNGVWVVAKADGDGNLVLDNHGKPQILSGQDSKALFTDTSKNAGGVDYASNKAGSNQTSSSLSGDTSDGPTGLLAWEDIAAKKKSNGSYDRPGDSDYNDAVFRISQVNKPPKALDDSNGSNAVIEAGVKPGGNTATAGDATASGNVLANDSDPDCDSLAVRGIAAGLTNVALSSGVGATIVGVYGTLVLNGNGKWTYTLNNSDADTNALAYGQSATDVFTYTVKDSNGATDNATLSICIAGTNDAPLAVNDSGSAGENEIKSFNVLANDTDVDNCDDLTLVSLGTATITGPSGVPLGSPTLAIASNQLKVTPGTAFDALAVGQTAMIVVPYTVHDAAGATSSAVARITVTGANDVPKFGTAITTATVTELPDNAPEENTRIHLATGTVRFDDVDYADAHTVSITPNATGYRGTISAVVSDAATGAGDGYVTWTYSVSDGALDDLAAGQTLAQSYTLTVNDGNGGTISKTVTVSLKGAADGVGNRAPVAGNDDYGVNEDGTLATGAPGVLANDSDPDGNPLSAVLVSGTAHGALTLNPNGSFNYAPTSNYNGTDSFSYRASDGSLQSSVTTVSITIAPVNDAPVAVDDTYTTNEDTPLTSFLSTIFSEDFSDNAAGWTLDPQWQIGSAQSSSGQGFGNPDPATDTSPTADNGVAGVVIGGNASTNLHSNFYLTSPVIDTTAAVNAIELSFARWLNSDHAPFMHNSIDVWDGSQWQNLWVSGGIPGIADSAWTQISHDLTAYSNSALQVRFGFDVDAAGAFNVSSWNLDDVQITTSTVTGTVLFNDTDAENGSLTASLVSGPSHGGLQFGSDGNFIYTPDAGFNGTDTFTYTTNDGEIDSNVATVTLNVTSLNDAPTAVNDVATVLEDSTGNVINVLDNDSDPDNTAGPANAGLTVIDVGSATHGTVLLDAGQVTYTPAANYDGDDSFVYIIRDAEGVTSAATVNVTIAPVNHAPIAVNDAYVTDEDTSLTSFLSTIFSEDFSDNSAGWTLGPQWQIGPAQQSFGQSSGNPDPATDNSPTADNGVAGVVIGGNASTAVHPYFYLTSPVINTTSHIGDFDLSFARWLNSDYAPFMHNSVDVWDGSQWQNVWVSGGPPAIMDSAWTQISHDITAYSNNALQVRFGVDVGQGGAFNVSSWNLDDVRITGTFAGSVLLNDTDLENDSLTATLVAGPSNGILDFNNDGTFIYTPNANFNGADSFTYQASDGSLTSTATVSITVMPVNDPVTISGDAAGAVTVGQAALLTDTGSFIFNDTDDADVITSSVSYLGSHNGQPFPVDLDAALASGLTIVRTGTNDGIIDWNFSVDNALVEYLNPGESLVVDYSVDVLEPGQLGGVTTPHYLTITITDLM